MPDCQIERWRIKVLDRAFCKLVERAEAEGMQLERVVLRAGKMYFERSRRGTWRVALPEQHPLFEGINGHAQG